MSEIVKQIFVISDLHIGGDYPVPERKGERGFRICTHAKELAEFINALAAKLSDGPKIELVINGDFIDFLAEKDSEDLNEPSWTPFISDPTIAAKRLGDIAERDKDFFGALKALLKNKHSLTVLLGNHDIELCFPEVRRKLEEILDAEGNGNYRFIYDGEAYQIGSALIEHGNQYDGWNRVDYESLGTVRALQSRRKADLEEIGFNPVLGSKVVAYIMNPIKNEYAFIDLLKPENETMIPILLALEPRYVKKSLANILKSSKAYKTLDDLKEYIRAFDIGSKGIEEIYGKDIGGPRSYDLDTYDPEDDLRSILKRSFGSEKEAEDFLDELKGWIDEDERDYSIGTEIASLHTKSILSFIGDLKSFASGLKKLLLGPSELENRLPLLRLALEKFNKKDVFNIADETTAEYIEAAKDISSKGGFRYVIFGHTHLPKKVVLDNGVCYLNTGTWSDLMKLPSGIISDERSEPEAELEAFVNALKEKDLSKYIIFNPTYVRLDITEEGDMSASLCKYAEPKNV